MEDKRFDDIIKGKLSNLSTEDTPRWDLFLEKKKTYAQKRSDQQFDNSLRSKLGDYRVDYNPSHWALLKERLERIYALRKKLYLIKSFELVVILLLASSLGNYLDVLVPDNALTNPAPIVKVETPSERNENELFNLSSSNATTEEEVIDNTEIASTDDLTALETSAVSDEVLLDDRSAEIRNGGNINSYVAIEAPFNPQRNTNLVTDVSTENVDLLETESNNRSLYSALSELNRVESALSLGEREAPLIENDFGIKPAKEYQDDRWLHLNVSFDNNLIFTAYDPEYNEFGPTFGEMFGFSAAAVYSIEKKSMEYEIGLGYSSFNKPWNFSNEFPQARRRYRYTLSNVHFDMVTIPLRANYHFVSNDDWSLYISGGLTPSVIVNSEYSEGEIEFIGLQPVLPGTIIPPAPELDELKAPFREDRDFTQGLFQGGSVSDNLMLHGSIGFGMQRNITLMTAVYFKGDLHYSLLDKVYGPTHIERINRFSFGFGLKRRL